VSNLPEFALSEKIHRYVFTLIHKFSIDQKLESEYPLITERKNVSKRMNP